MLGAGLRGQATGPGYKAGQHGKATYRAVLLGRATRSGYGAELLGQGTGPCYRAGIFQARRLSYRARVQGRAWGQAIGLGYSGYRARVRGRVTVPGYGAMLQDQLPGQGTEPGYRAELRGPGGGQIRLRMS